MNSLRDIFLKFIFYCSGSQQKKIFFNFFSQFFYFGLSIIRLGTFLIFFIKVSVLLFRKVLDSNKKCSESFSGEFWDFFFNIFQKRLFYIFINSAQNHVVSSLYIKFYLTLVAHYYTHSFSVAVKLKNL